MDTKKPEANYICKNLTKIERKCILKDFINLVTLVKLLRFQRKTNKICSLDVQKVMLHNMLALLQMEEKW